MGVLQDARVVRVTDSYFENLREADLRYVDRCVVGTDNQRTVDCGAPREQLFISESNYSSKRNYFTNYIFNHLIA